MIKHWFLIDEKLRFLICASLVMFLRFLIFSGLLIIYSPKHYQIILAFTWLFSSFFAFLIYKYLVFTSIGNHLHQYIKSLIIWVGSYIVNIFILALFIEKLTLSPYLAQGIAILLLLTTNYLLFKHFTFKKGDKSIVTKIYDILD